ncbi:MAG: hypothetical protein AAF585_20755, partial [Verrucomicrobiota bacterium]
IELLLELDIELLLEDELSVEEEEELIGLGDYVYTNQVNASRILKIRKSCNTTLSFLTNLLLRSLVSPR